MKSICKITFDGLNFEKLLNTLQKEQIPVLKATKKSKFGCELVIYTAFCKKVVALLHKKCYNNIYVTKLGWYRLWQRCQRHLAIFVAICLVIPTLWMSSAFCLRISVDSSLPKSQVLEALSQQGVKIGTLQKSVDCKALQSNLAGSLGVAYALVRQSGSTLYVKLIDLVPDSPIVDLTKPCDVVASCDGVVQRMVVLQGTPLVKVGDYVTKGQVLVEGKRHYNDGTFDSLCAIAQVYATVQQSATVDFCPTQSVLVDTDQFFERTTITLGSYVSQKPIPFEQFRLVSQQSVCLGGVVLTKQVFCEQRPMQVEVQLAQVEHQLRQQALELATSKASFVVTSVQYDVQPNAVTATVTGSIDIASTTN